MLSGGQDGGAAAALHHDARLPRALQTTRDWSVSGAAQPIRDEGPGGGGWVTLVLVQR